VATVARRAADDIDTVIGRIDAFAGHDFPEFSEDHQDMGDVYTEGPRLAMRLRAMAERLDPMRD
jgi:hypothetical protein